LPPEPPPSQPPLTASSTPSMDFAPDDMEPNPPPPPTPLKPPPDASTPQTACRPCKDRQTPYMLNRGLTCAAQRRYIVNNRCNSNPRWVAERYCELTCLANGVGYGGVRERLSEDPSMRHDDGECCLPPPTHPPPAPPVPPVPPAMPPHVPGDIVNLGPQPCIPCTDTPTPYMESRGISCARWANFITNNRCSANDDWLLKRYCEYTCEVNGVGYWASLYGSVCC
jgi:hypothetical protein